MLLNSLNFRCDVAYHALNCCVCVRDVFLFIKLYLFYHLFYQEFYFFIFILFIHIYKYLLHRLGLHLISLYST